MDDKDFMRACLLSKSTVTANLLELSRRHANAVRQTIVATEALRKKRAILIDDNVLTSSTLDTAIDYLKSQVEASTKSEYDEKLKASFYFVRSWDWRQTAKDILKDKNEEIDQLKMKLVALKRLYVAK